LQKEIEQYLGTSFEQLLLELMLKTGREEKQIAEQIILLMKEINFK